MVEEYNRLEIKAIDMINDLMRLIYNHIVKRLTNMLDCLMKGECADITSELENLRKTESECILLKNEILDKISEAEGMMQRGDLMRLIMQIAHLADSSVGLGYRIQAASAWVPDEVSREKIMKMMNKVDESIKLIRESIFLLPQNAKKAVESIKDVENIEREVDEIQRDLVQYSYDLDLDFKTILRIRDLIIRLEEISDISADISDSIRVLAVRRFGSF